ncbi:hypothetical protein SDC9_16881 [bioreactor metagenome]|uniref:Uncharacterized protein n=1 Tax=bioreactor metagenome TaxID=1076179 RepID=A0A644TZP5_9ZZZZ
MSGVRREGAAPPAPSALDRRRRRDDRIGDEVEFGAGQPRGKARVAGTHQHRAGLRQLRQLAEELPVPEGAGIVLAQPEDLHADAARLGLVLQAQCLGIGPVAREVELQAVGGAGLGAEGGRHVKPGALVQLRGDVIVVRQPVAHAARHLGQLRPDHRGREVLHSGVVERQLVLPVHEAVLQPRVLLPVVLVGARHDDRAGGEFWVIGDQHPAFAGIHQLVALEAEAADLADRADLAIAPDGAQAVRGILDHRHALRVGQCHDRVHVRGVAAHVRDQHRRDAVVELFPEVVEIDAEVLAHLDQNRHAIGMHDRRGHGGEGEGGHQHPRAARQVERLQRQEQRGRAGGDGDGIAGAHEGGEFGLELRYRRILRGVAEQIARAEEPLDLGAGGLGDGLGVIAIRRGTGRGEIAVTGHEFQLS